jgi:GR25 family glycosyltransferase involved in LPS biosynthesis
MTNTPKLKVFVIHAKFLELRKPLCETTITKLKAANNLKVDVEFLEEYDPDQINMNEVSDMIALTKSGKSELFDNMLRNMHIKQVSNALKHFKALQKATNETADYDYFMVLEDDVIHGEDVTTRIVEAIETRAQSNWDMLFLGEPSLTPIQSDKMIIKPVQEFFKVIPCCDSYLIPADTVSKIANAFGPIRFPTHIQFSFMTETNKDLNISMCTPNIFLDGSKFGVYLSCLEPNNRLFLNPDYNKINMAVRKDEYTEEDIKNITQMFEQMRFKNHPDVLFLQGMFEQKQKNYTKAKEIFEQVYTISMQNNCIVNNESELLNVYMSTFKHVQ